MTTPPTFPEATDPSDRGHRLLIGLGALIALAVGTVITLGAALISLAAIAVTWFIKRGGPRPLTRGTAWFIGVGATALPMLLLLLGTSLSQPRRSPEQVRLDVAAARSRQRDSMPAWLRKLPGSQPQSSPAVDSVAQRLVASSGFMAWFTAMGSVIAAGLLGLFAGTVGWGISMIIFRAAKGEWMGMTVRGEEL